MKDAVITVRLPRATRKRIEKLAREEGRSLSQQTERLIERAMQGEVGTRESRGIQNLAGSLRGGRVPTLDDFQEVRSLLSQSFGKKATRDAERRR